MVVVCRRKVGRSYEWDEAFDPIQEPAWNRHAAPPAIPIFITPSKQPFLPAS